MSSRDAAGNPSERLLQIDVIKGLSILAVIVTHTFAAEDLLASWAVFHVWLAVPVFIVVAGYNSFASFAKTGETHVGSLFTWSYVRRRLVRLLAPFAVIWMMSYLVGASRGALEFGRVTLLLKIPYRAPGNYFVTVLVTLVLLAPVLYAAYRRWPAVTLIAAFALDLSFEFWAESSGLINKYVYAVAFIRYLAVFALGFWLADPSVRTRQRAAVLSVGGILSLVYTVASMSGIAVPFALRWGNANALSAFLPTLVVWLALRWLPSESENGLLNTLGFIGRASYHIFLFQMLYFPLVGKAHTEVLAANLFVTVVGGIGFALIEERLRVRTLRLSPDGA